MKKCFVMIVILLIGFTPLHVLAAGSIEVQLPDNMNGIVQYDKVATIVNGEWIPEDDYVKSGVDFNALENAKDVENAVGLLLSCAEHMMTYSIQEEENTIQGLEAGMYLLKFESQEPYEISPALVTIPEWTGETMLNDVQFIPKYIKKQKSPRTGDNNDGQKYILLAAVSVLAVVVTLKCGKVQRVGV